MPNRGRPEGGGARPGNFRCPAAVYAPRTTAYALGARGAAAMDHHLLIRNRLLAALAPSDFALLAPQLTAFSLDEGAILQEDDAPIEEVYFPIRGLISLVTVMRTGEMVETAMVGRERAIGRFAGLASAHAFEAHAFARAIVQIPGTAAAIPASRLRAAVNRSDGLRQ